MERLKSGVNSLTNSQQQILEKLAKLFAKVNSKSTPAISTVQGRVKILWLQNLWLEFDMTILKGYIEMDHNNLTLQGSLNRIFSILRARRIPLVFYFYLFVYFLFFWWMRIPLVGCVRWNNFFNYIKHQRNNEFHLHLIT